MKRPEIHVLKVPAHVLVVPGMTGFVAMIDPRSKDYWDLQRRMLEEGCAVQATLGLNRGTDPATKFPAVAVHDEAKIAKGLEDFASIDKRLRAEGQRLFRRTLLVHADGRVEHFGTTVPIRSRRKAA